jgi:hypothetical protein
MPTANGCKKSSAITDSKNLKGFAKQDISLYV